MARDQTQRGLSVRKDWLGPKWLIKTQAAAKTSKIQVSWMWLVSTAKAARAKQVISKWRQETRTQSKVTAVVLKTGDGLMKKVKGPKNFWTWIEGTSATSWWRRRAQEWLGTFNAPQQMSSCFSRVTSFRHQKRASKLLTNILPYPGSWTARMLCASQSLFSSSYSKDHLSCISYSSRRKLCRTRKADLSIKIRTSFKSESTSCEWISHQTYMAMSW